MIFIRSIPRRYGEDAHVRGLIARRLCAVGSVEHQGDIQAGVDHVAAARGDVLRRPGSAHRTGCRIAYEQVSAHGLAVRQPQVAEGNPEFGLTAGAGVGDPRAVGDCPGAPGSAANLGGGQTIRPGLEGVIGFVVAAESRGTTQGSGCTAVGRAAVQRVGIQGDDVGAGQGVLAGEAEVQVVRVPGEEELHIVHLAQVFTVRGPFGGGNHRPVDAGGECVGGCDPCPAGVGGPGGVGAVNAAGSHGIFHSPIGVILAPSIGRVAQPHGLTLIRCS